VYGKTKNNFGYYDHVTVYGLCLADNVSDMPASSIQLQIFAFVTST
jgi:hypothetical protein